jgi:transketolase
LKAQSVLESEGINVRVIDAYSVKPIDTETLRKAAADTGHLVVVEDHFAEGGLGDAVLDAVGNRSEVRKIAIRGVARSGKPNELIEAFGIDAGSIAKEIRGIVS